MKERWQLPGNDWVINALILLLSYLVLFWMPSVSEIVGYILLGISAFLFCIGYFRLIAVLPVPASQRTAIVWEKTATILGLMTILLSGWLVFCNGGSVGSIIAGTLLLIESLVVIDHSFTSAEEENGGGDLAAREKHNRQQGFFLHFAAVMMVGFGVWSAIRNHWNGPSVAMFTLMVIAALVVWGMGSSHSSVS